MFQSKPRHLSLLTAILAMAILVFAGAKPGWALHSDRDQPIDIRADRVEVNEKEEVSQYVGNVHLKQGTLDIKADKITVYLSEGRLTKIAIRGNPATFKQQPEDKQDIVKSSARYMEYFASKEHLVLKTNAQVVQGANHFSGDYIEYDTLNSTVKANKDEDSGSRVHAIIQPKADTDEEAPQTPTPQQ